MQVKFIISVKRKRHLPLEFALLRGLGLLSARISALASCLFNLLSDWLFSNGNCVVLSSCNVKTASIAALSLVRLASASVTIVGWTFDKILLQRARLRAISVGESESACKPSLLTISWNSPGRCSVEVSINASSETVSSKNSVKTQTSSRSGEPWPTGLTSASFENHQLII